MSGTVRRQKYGRLILKKGKATSFQQTNADGSDPSLLRPADVRMSPDLSFAKVYIQYDAGQDKDKLLSLLDTPKIRKPKALANASRNQARIVPKVAFPR